RPQDDSQATLAPAIQPEDGLIRWDETAAAIDCRIRGVSPKPGAFATIQGRRVKIWAAKPVGNSERAAAPGKGIGFRKVPSGLLVAAGSGTVALLTEAQPDNGKRMPAADWARGLRLTPGDRFEMA